MDWYFKRDDDDVIVPSSRRTSDLRHADDRSPYPSACFQWEVSRMENFVPPNKFAFSSMKPIATGTGLNFNCQSLSENFEPESSIIHGEGSSDQSIYGDLSLVDSSSRTLEASSPKHEHLGDEQMDDFWESVFIEDPPNLKNLSNSHDSAYTSMPFGNLLTDMLMDPQDSLKDSSFMGCMSCLKGSFTAMTDYVAEDGDQLEDVSPSSVADNSKSPEGSPTASVLSVLVPAEVTTSEIVRHVQETKYLEAIVLQELEDVMSQLKMETRICFRDALYRLAKISEQHRSLVKNKPSSDVDGENSCHDSAKSVECKTNAIDRTVANLMFNKADSGPPGLPCSRRVHEHAEPSQYSESYNDISNEPVILTHHHHPASLPCGIEVPSCKAENRNRGDLFSGVSCLNPAGAMDYTSDMSSDQAEDSANLVDQFGANQQLEFLQSRFAFTVAFPRHQDGV